MCGIVGTVKYRDKEILHKMNEIQVHRGPDSEGIFWSEELLVGLAMRRLSIVDLENNREILGLYRKQEKVRRFRRGAFFICA